MSHIDIRLRPYWVLVYTHAKREAWAAENIQKQGCEFYLPKCKFSPPLGQPVIEPLFPRYLFARTRGPWRWLLSTKGITTVVMSNEGPARVPRSLITSLQASHNSEGLIELSLSPAQEELVKDMPVKVSGTSLAGRVKKLVGRDRVRVLLDFMGGATLTVNRKDLTVCYD